MLTFNFHPFPELKTDRLILRQVEEDDAEEIFFLRSDPAVLTYLGKEPARSIKEAVDFIKRVNFNVDTNDAIFWGIALKDSPYKLIGTICIWNIQKEHFRGDVGYVLHPAYWGKGLMKEALRAVVDFGYDKMKLHSFAAEVDPKNVGSTALLESLGFIREGLLKENLYFKGNFTDTAIYSKINNNQ
jgi:ribosomal-protein-alanine N-acetyltransferase